MEDADDEPLFADDLEGLSDQDDVPPLPPPMPSFDDVDGLPRSPPPEPAAGVASNAEAGDGQPAQKKRKPLLTLTNERIFSEKGIPYLPKEFSKLKFRGKGNEAADLAYLLKQYEHWANRLFPKLTSTDVTDRIESLAKKKEFKGQLKDLRRRWIRGSTPPIIDDDDDDMGNADSRGIIVGSGDGATGAGGDGATGTGGDGGTDGDGASDEDDDLWGERPLATIRPHSRNVTHDAEKENSPPSGNGAEGSWKLALDTEDQRTSEGGSRPKGDSRSTEGSWKLELKTEDQHTSEGSSRSKGDSRSTEGSWKLAMDTEDHHTSEGGSRPKGDSRSTEGSWKLAMDTEDHHTSEGSSRPKGGSRSTEGSWKLELKTDDNHTSEAISRSGGDSHSWRSALGSDNSHSPVLDKGDSHGPKGRRLAASANETPTEVVQGQGYNGDGAEEFHFDDRHLSPVLEGSGYHSSRELALDKDNRCTTDIHGDDENSEPHTESRDSYTASPVLNSRRCSSHKRQQLVWSDDSEDELKLCIDEDSAKEE